MEPQEFAAKRQERLLAADNELRDLVRDALSAWDGEGEFHPADLEEAVEVIWLEHFSAEAPRADYERFLPRFRKILTESLAQTSPTSAGEPEDYEVERVTVFLGTLAVNDGTFRGAGARGGKFKRWTSMHDPSVRHAHSLIDGQVRSINEPFTVEGTDLQYPGQPVGPPEVWINCRCVAQPAAVRGDANVSDTTMTLSDDFDSRSRSLTAAADGDEPHTGVGVFLIPAEGDPIVAASSEDQAHMTTVWLGSMEDLDEETLNAIVNEVRAYAATLDGPVIVPAADRGALGDEGADVQFLEKTDALVALRDGLLEASPTVARVMNSVEQFPDWTPHVTLGYPEAPAAGEYDGDAVTFDRVGLWIGPDKDDYPMGDPVSKPDAATLASARALIAAATETDVEIDETDPEMPVDELEEDEELITEIPVHGVATLEGKATGDHRGFRPNAISFGRLPAPLGYEFESGHGSDNSRVAIVGRIDEFFTVPAPGEPEGVFEVRWRGVIMPGKEYGARAIESIIDGSYDGNSVIVDEVTVDVTEERESLRAMFLRERDTEMAAGATDEETKQAGPLTDEQIEAMLDDFVGDGTQPTTWFSKARVRRFDMVPTGAFQEGYVRLGHEFDDELTEEQLITAAGALADCGCSTRLVASGANFDEWVVVDLTGLTQEERDAYDLLDLNEQREFAKEHNLLASAGFAPGTKDGPGWITNPVGTSRIRRYWTKGEGAAKIGWGTPGDFNRCRNQLAKYVQNPEWLAGLCANMHYEVLGVWPNPGGKRGDKGHSLAASATAEQRPLVVMAAASAPERSVFPASAFQAPREGRAFAMRIDREARTIVGYAAAWGTCHIGIAGTCEEPPRTQTDYSYFRKGVVDTDEGEQRVALITAGIGHAGGRYSPAAATAHYDQTNAVRAYINIGEDEHGIWYAGVIPSFVTDAQIDEIRAIGRVSGDWRSWTGRPYDLEMVGLVVVNTDGFQLAASAALEELDGLRADAGQVAIGIGALEKGEGDEPVLTAAASDTIALTRDDIVGIALAAAEGVVSMQRRQGIIDRVAPARAAIEAYSLAAARAELAKFEEV